MPATVASSQHRECDEVSAGNGTIVVVRCPDSPIANIPREIR